MERKRFTGVSCDHGARFFLKDIEKTCRSQRFEEIDLMKKKAIRALKRAWVFVHVSIRFID